MAIRCRTWILFHGTHINWGFCNDSTAKQDPHISAKLMAVVDRLRLELCHVPPRTAARDTLSSICMTLRGRAP